MSPLNITQPLDSIGYMVYNGYYKVMSNIPKMGHLPTPALWGIWWDMEVSISMGVAWKIIHFKKMFHYKPVSNKGTTIYANLDMGIW